MERSLFCKAIFELVLVLVMGVAVYAQKKSITLPPDNPVAELKAGTGMETVRNNCRVCHSTDYIVTQPPLDAARWDAEVKKMITVFGARITEADAKTIAQYLANNYGSD